MDGANEDEKKEERKEVLKVLRNTSMVQNTVSDFEKGITEIEFFLEKSSGYVKWTTGISVFLITATIAILTFKDGVSNYMEILMLVVLLPLAANVYFGWRISYKTFVLHSVIVNTKIVGEEEQGLDDNKWEGYKLSEQIDFSSKCHYYSFLVGFFLFLAVAIGYILIEKLLS